MESKPGFSSIFSSRAQKEIAVSWDWYEERLQGLGDRFLTEILERISVIENNPDRFPTRHKNYKEAVLPTFPFLIIYRVSTKKRSIRIVSVFHTSRNPKRKYG
jgi:plasmid stabilization system protein ParE